MTTTRITMIALHKSLECGASRLVICIIYICVIFVLYLRYICVIFVPRALECEAVACASRPAISLTCGSWDPDLYFCHIFIQICLILIFMYFWTPRSPPDYFLNVSILGLVLWSITCANGHYMIDQAFISILYQGQNGGSWTQVVAKDWVLIVFTNPFFYKVVFTLPTFISIIQTRSPSI